MKVLRANMFRNSVALLTDTNEELELTLDECRRSIPGVPTRRRARQGNPMRSRRTSPRRPVRMTS